VNVCADQKAWLAQTPFTPRADTPLATRPSSHARRAALRENFRLNENAGRVTYLQDVSTSTHNPDAEAIRRRRHRALVSILLTIPCVFMAFIISDYVRSKDQPVLTADGRRIYESYLVFRLKMDIPFYSLVALAGFFFVRGIVIRFRPLPSTKTNDAH
jgi:hypothetical protein